MRTFILALITLLVPVTTGAAESYKVAREYQIKAAFLYNFANFITWPADAFADAEAEFNICLLGTDPFGKMLGLTIENVTAKNRKLKALYLQDNLGGIVDCHLLYVHPDMAAHMAEIVTLIGDRPILTVGEEKKFITQGGMIGFYTENKKMRLAITQERLEDVKLKADANLLRLSLICKPEGCEE